MARGSLDDTRRHRRASLSLAYRNGNQAMAAALVAATVTALLLGAPTPLEPVAATVMDRTPVAIAIPLLLNLGALARPLALFGAAMIMLVAGGLLALLYPFARREPVGSGGPPAPLRAVIALGLLGGLAALVVPPEHAVVVAVLASVYVLTLYLLAHPVPYRPGRRRFLGHNARVIAALGVLIVLFYVEPLAAGLRARGEGRPLFDWSPSPPRKKGFAIEGLTPEMSTVGAGSRAGEFYQMDEDLERPEIALDTWRLDVGGLVRRPLSLSFADVLALPRHDEIVTQECVSNPVGGPLMSTALFSGVSIAALLDRVGVAAGATAVAFRAPDGHEESIPLDLAGDGRVLLAYAMNGRLLERAHGFPLRALIPGYYGYKAVKWVESVRLTTDAAIGYWEHNGWAALPAVKTTARIDAVHRTPSGLLVAGVAFAGRRGVRGVQVRVNRGPWRFADLHTPALSPLTWVQWRLLLPVRGPVTLQARAVDGDSVIQTATVHDQYPSGATGYHTVQA